MAKFITIGYGDESDYLKTSADIKEVAHAHDEWLVERGAVVVFAGSPTQVSVLTRTAEHAPMKVLYRKLRPIAGFALIEQNADEAVELVSKTPCAVAYGVVEGVAADRPFRRVTFAKMAVSYRRLARVIRRASTGLRLIHPVQPQPRATASWSSPSETDRPRTAHRGYPPPLLAGRGSL